MKIKINDNHNKEIDGIEIDDSIFNDELTDYTIVDTDDMVDDLISWIAECNTQDKQIMKDDLKYLMNLTDEYVFSSISTNKFIAFSDNTDDTFIDICENILSLQKDLTQ